MASRPALRTAKFLFIWAAGRKLVKSDTVTPQNLFDKPIRYVVPLYQRPYVWDKEKQWQPLWEDIRTTAEALDELVASGMPMDKSLAVARRHFLGAVVVQSMVAGARFIPERFVIDGQQRLTTLQLLLDATRRVVGAVGSEQSAAILDGMIRNEARFHQITDDEFKVWPTNLDRPLYRNLMSAEGLVSYGAQPSGRMKDAHRYFSEEIADWYNSEGDAGKRQRRLNSLVTTLRELLELVEITLDDNDNAQVIFETLNHRGTPLEASDLVKNYLFQEVEATGAKSEPLYDKYWQQFDTEPWRGKVSQGRLYRPRLDVFLQHWLILRTLKDVAATEVFSAFRTYTGNTQADPTAGLHDLHSLGESWTSFDTEDPRSCLGTFIYRQRVMQADSVSPILLWLYDPASPTPLDQQERALGALESWLVRRMLCRLTTKDYNNIRVELLGALAKKPADVRGAGVEAFLLEQTADSRFWPTNEQVRVALLTLPLYRQLTRSRLRMVLEGIEDHLRGTKAEEQVVRGRLTIEHVLPQGWTAHWPPPPSDGADEPVERRNMLLHTLGNLTLLTQALNSDASNAAWDVKRKKLEEHSVLRLTAALLQHDAWDDDAIRARSAALADTVCTVWPRPA